MRKTLAVLGAVVLLLSLSGTAGADEWHVIGEPDDPPASNVFGNPSLPDWKDVGVDNSDSKWLEINNADGLVFRFAKEKDKFNEIYQDSTLIVKDEKWLIYFDNKEGGSTVGLEWERLENYNVKVTQFYEDKTADSGSSYKVIWDFYGGFRPKITVELETGVAGNYKIDWRVNLYKDYAENMSNYARFWDENDNDAIVFDYSDVYEAFGDITEVEIEEWANDHKLNEYFYVGQLGVENFRLDPNFGYENVGGATASLGDDIRGSWFTCPEAGTADNITAYMDVLSGSHPVKCALYKKSDNSLVDNTEEKTVDADGWVTFDFATSPTLEATDYWIVVWGSSAFIRIAYDTGVVDDGFKEDLIYGDWPNPIDASGTNNYKHSIYCSYTAGAPPAPGQPVIISPENQYSTSDNTPTFKWENGSDATSHRLVIDNSENFDDGDNIYDNASAWDNSGTTIENELPIDNYWWKVAAVNAQGENWSENTWTFEITAAEWNLIETWTGTVNAPAVWQVIESWTGTVNAPVPPEWKVTETWTGTVSAPAQYHVVETWSGTINKIPPVPPPPPERWEMPDPVLLLVLVLVMMTLAMAFDSPIFAFLGGVMSVFVGLMLIVDTLWVGIIFLGLGVYFILIAVMSDEEGV